MMTIRPDIMVNGSLPEPIQILMVVKSSNLEPANEFNDKLVSLTIPDIVKADIVLRGWVRT